MERLRNLNRKLTSCRRGVLILLASASLLSLTTCENLLSAFIQQDEEYQKNLLGFTVSPETGHWITGNETIRIVFAEGVNINSLVLSGTLGISESDIVPIDWSSTSGQGYDTLNLSPNAIGGLWPEGSKTLILSVTSSTGKTVKALSIDFDIQYEICVKEYSPLDTPDGSVRFPYNSIQNGINAVSSVYNPALGTIIPVRIAVGAYSGSCDYGTAWVANLANQVSLHGGYNADFSELSSSGETELINSSNSDDVDFYNPSSVLYCGSVIGNPVIENITIQLGGNASATGVHAGIHTQGGDPIFRNIKIKGISTGGPSYAFGILVEGGSPAIQNPDINPGHAQSSSVGMYIYDGGSPTVTGNNFILHRVLSGKGEGHAFGIVIEGGSGSISGITIEGPTVLPLPDGDPAEFPISGGCILLYSNSTVINNNKFIQYPNTSLFAVYEFVTLSDPASFTNNDFAIPNPGTSNWYRDHDTGNNISQSNYDSLNITNGTTGKLLDPAGFNNYSSTYGINN